MTDTSPRIDRPALLALLDELDQTLERADLPLPVPARDDTLRRQVGLLRSIRDYLSPRLRDGAAPLVAVVVGAGGTGKSSVVNTLADGEIGKAGPVRPTTTRPVVWAHRDHPPRYWQEFVTRMRERVGPAVETVLGGEPLLDNLTLIDCPPPEVLGDGGRPVVEELLAISDLAIVVASVGRYADAAAWELAAAANARGLPMLFVMNRLPAAAADRRPVLDDYARQLASAGLLLSAEPSLLFTFTEQQPDPVHGGLVGESADSLRRELAGLSDPELADRLAGQAMHGALSALTAGGPLLAADLDIQAAVSAELIEMAEASYAAQRDRLIAELEAGELASLAGRPWPEAAAETVRWVTRLAGAASQEAAAAWDDHPVGRAILDGDGQVLWRHGPETAGDVAARVEAWRSAVDGVATAQLPRRVSRRKRRRLAARLRAAAVAPARAPAVGDDELAGWAGAALSEALTAALGVDAARFLRFTGDPGVLRRRADHIREASAAVAGEASG